MIAVVDAALLAPPPDLAGEVDDWVLATRAWQKLLAEESLYATCPTIAVDAALLAWWQHQDRHEAALRSNGAGLTVPDLVRVVDSLASQLESSALSPPRDVIVEDVGTEPSYVASLAKSAVLTAVLDHLAEAAFVATAKDEPAVLGTSSCSWSADCEAVKLRGRLTMWIDEGGREHEPRDGAAGLEAAFVACFMPADVRRVLSDHPHLLANSPKLATALAWQYAGRTEPLTFQVAKGFTSTFCGMGYDKKGNLARAASLWRAMAFIAAGKAAELNSLEAHPHHQSGAGSDAHKDARGRTLYRGWLSQGPNAHRIFWWAGEKPEFLGVTGHDDPPPL